MLELTLWSTVHIALDQHLHLQQKGTAFLSPQLWKVLGGPRSPHLQRFTTNQSNFEGISELSSLKLYVMTPKIVSYSCIFWWLREHVIKADSYWYKSSLSLLSSHSYCFKISRDSIATNDQWRNRIPKVNEALPVRWSLIWILWVIGGEQRSHVPTHVLLTHPWLGVSAHIC